MNKKRGRGTFTLTVHHFKRKKKHKSPIILKIYKIAKNGPSTTSRNESGSDG